MQFQGEWNKGQITEHALETLRKRIGIERVRNVRNWNTVATADNIWHFAVGIGDDNPLWCNPEYAKNTHYGRLVAPPTFAFSLCISEQEGLPGVPTIMGLGGVSYEDWVLQQPILENDRFRVSFILLDIVEKKSPTGGRMIQQITQLNYWNQRDELVVKRILSMPRMEISTVRQELQKVSRPKHRWSQAELEALYHDYEQETRRGATPRYWEDVSVGEELPQVMKGPQTITTEVFAEGGIGMTWTATHRMLYNIFRRHPGAMAIEPETNVPDLPAAIHWVDGVAQQLGLPAAYEAGPQRVCWLVHLLTNWMGDDGFVKRFHVDITENVCLQGDAQWCRGRVIDKRHERDEHLVECEMWAVNQLGQTTARGTATIRFPARGL